MSAKDDASAEFTKEACQGFRPGEGAIALPYEPSWFLGIYEHPQPTSTQTQESRHIRPAPSAQRPAPRTTSSSSRICIYEQNGTKLEAKLHFFSISSFIGLDFCESGVSCDSHFES
jgi:hypothetical protein